MNFDSLKMVHGQHGTKTEPTRYVFSSFADTSKRFDGNTFVAKLIDGMSFQTEVAAKTFDVSQNRSQEILKLAVNSGVPELQQKAIDSACTQYEADCAAARKSAEKMENVCIFLGVLAVSVLGGLAVSKLRGGSCHEGAEKRPFDY